ncbi:MAG: type II secretion system F family protein [Thiohalomonadaceae bacterium]
MALFQYKARDARGELVRGELEAGNADALAGQLLNSGMTPLEILPLKKRADVWGDLKKRLGSSRPTLDDLILFCRQMYTLSKAGVPIIRAINGLAETTRNTTLAEVLTKLRQDLESGRELNVAMEMHREVFTPLMISMVRVGENSGKMDQAFAQLASYLELERDTRKRIKAAIRYPSFVIVAIALAIAVVNIFVIPAFAGVFASMNRDLPWQTQILINTSNFTVAYWPYLLGAMLLAGAGLNYYIRSEGGRYRWGRLKLRLPIVGSIITRATLGRFTRSFAMASKSGVPLIQALTVVSRAVDNDFVTERILSMRNGIERGDSMTRTAAATGLFTPLVLQMLAVGEETGAVDQMMDEVSDFYEREVDYELQNLSSAIEPILIVAVGVLVLILALGIFLPMWDMTSLARG